MEKKKNEDNKTVLEKLREVILGEEEIKLAEMSLEDGTVLFAESFEPGESVFIVDGEERVALAVGEYALTDGSVLAVTTEGVIDAIAMPEAEEEGLTEEDLSAVESLKKTNEDLAAENEKLKEAMKPKLSVEKKGIKPSPEGKINLAKVVDVPTRVDKMRMSVKERVNLAMQNTPFYDNLKLATTTSITTTYVGEFSSGYIAAATLQGATLASNAITVKPNIKKAEKIKKLTVSGLLADATCDFSPTGNVALTERSIDPKELQVNLELCKTDFADDFEAISMGYSAWDVLPPTFQAFFAEEIAAQVNASIETSIWHGVAATAGQFRGLIPTMTADSDVIDEAGTTITSANVIAEMKTVVDKIPQAIFDEPDLVLYVAPNVMRAYVNALGGFIAAGVGAQGTDNKGTQWYSRGSGVEFDGIPVFSAPGMSSNYMVAAQASNLWYGTGLLNDNNEVRIVDMSPIDLSKNVRFAMRFTADTNYGIGSEIVLYTPA